MLKRPASDPTQPWQRVDVDLYPAGARLVAGSDRLFGAPLVGRAKSIPLAGGAWVAEALPGVMQGGVSYAVRIGTAPAAVTLDLGPSGPAPNSMGLSLRVGGGWQQVDLPAAIGDRSGPAGFDGTDVFFYRPAGAGLRIESRSVPGGASWNQRGPDLPPGTSDAAQVRVSGGKVWALESSATTVQLHVRELAGASSWRAIPIDPSLVSAAATPSLECFDTRIFLVQEGQNATTPAKLVRVKESGLVATTGLDLLGVNDGRLDSDGGWLYACGLTNSGQLGIRRMPLDGTIWEPLGAAPAGQVGVPAGCAVDRAGKRLFVSTTAGIWVSQ